MATIIIPSPPKLLFLFILLTIYWSTTRCAEEGKEGLISEKNAETGAHEHHQEQMNPELLVFFTTQDLHIGKKLTIHFPKRNISSSMDFLTKEEAQGIPFSSKELPHLLRLFSLDRSSARARAVEGTLRACEGGPIGGEVKTCATSWESLDLFIMKVFGKRREEVRVIRTVHLKMKDGGGGGGGVENYRIIGVDEERRGVGVVVSCHTMAYPYLVLYCHSQRSSETKVFRVDLEGGGGSMVDAVAVCHFNTSMWNSDHVAFKVLGVAPGTSPVCHFFPSDNFLLLVPLSASFS